MPPRPFFRRRKGRRGTPGVGQSLATYTFASTGWSTAGLPLPQGAVPSGQRAVYSGLDTQCDIKTTWSDGSARFVILTANIPSTGDRSIITASSHASTTFTPTEPTVSLALTISGVTWTATAGTGTSDAWLSGANVMEWRRGPITPLDGSTPHSRLRVYFDIRRYSDGALSVETTIENGFRTSGDRVIYDAALTVDGVERWSRTSLTHNWMARWTQKWDSFTEVLATPDTTYWATNGAVPRIASTVPSATWDISTSAFNPLGIGNLNPDQTSPGGRNEIGFVPEWTAQFLQHRTTSQRAAVIRYGELAGSLNGHARESDGSFTNIATATDIMINGNGGTGFSGSNQATAWDIAHLPQMALVPYFLTGRRYFHDEIVFNAHWCTLQVFTSSTYNARSGGNANTNPARWVNYSYTSTSAEKGILHPGSGQEQVRGMGWGLRNITDAAIYCADGEATRTQLNTIVSNNLTWLDEHRAAIGHPLGFLFPGHRNSGDAYSRVSMWEHTYLLYSVDRAHRLGFTGGETTRDQIAACQIGLLTNDADFPAEYGAAYELLVYDPASSAPKTALTTWAAIYNQTLTTLGSISETLPNSSYVGEAWAAVDIGIARGVANASSAMSYLVSVGADGARDNTARYAVNRN